MSGPDLIDARLLALLACPRDHGELQVENGGICCAHGHSYPVVDGVPVFLLAEREQTIGIAAASLQAAEHAAGARLYVDTIGLTDDQRHAIARDWTAGAKIDSVISYLIGATSGWGYVDLVGRLQNYPIPDIPVGRANGELLLDIGSNWGRWSVSAARKGWRVVGIEPSLGAIMAARRAFSNMGLDMAFICGDARFLPFQPDLFQCVFSYSVIQHFSEADAELAITEMGRVLRRGGFAKIQMANRGGLRSTYSRTRPNYLEGGSFRVRYWSLAAMREVFERHIGGTRLSAEAFGGLGLLAEDRNLVSAKAKMLIAASTLLKRLSASVPVLINFADSVYVASIKP
jgi:SAM-dependent methyltransferase